MDGLVGVGLMGARLPTCHAPIHTFTVKIRVRRRGSFGSRRRFDLGDAFDVSNGEANFPAAHGLDHEHGTLLF
jgi:hypothetical protein